MNYTKEILEKVKNCGILQYTIEKVVALVAPGDSELYEDLQNPESAVNFVYNQGLEQGKYRLDIVNFKLASAEAEKATLEAKREKEVDSMISEYLGETKNEEAV